jgi:hypothetical protein
MDGMKYAVEVPGDFGNVVVRDRILWLSEIITEF